MSASPNATLEDLLYKSDEQTWSQINFWMKEFGDMLFPSGNPDAISPFVLAAYRGKYDTVCQLLEGATEPHTAINATSRIVATIRGSGHLECLTSVTALLASSISGQADIAEYLLEHGADVNAVDCCGWTPLCRAAARGDTAITGLLLDHCSDVNHVTPNGFTAAHLAAMNCDINTLQLLGKHGAILSDDSSNDVPCPLYVAAASGHREVVERLTSDEKCPMVCKINAELLLGAAIYLQSGALVPLHSDYISGCQALAVWRDALSLLDYHGLQLNVAAPSTYYGSEITDVREFDDACRNGWFPQVLYQSLMIRERCLGPHYTVIPEMMDWLSSFAKQTRTLVVNPEADSPWSIIAPVIIHIMDIHFQSCQKYFERAQYCQLLEGIDTATSYILSPIILCSGYESHPDMYFWIACVEYATSLLQLRFLMSASEGYPCGNPPKLIPLIIDFLMHIALVDDITMDYESAESGSIIECSLELVNACRQFVETCALHPEQAGEVLNATMSQSARKSGKESGVLLQLLLHWFVHCGASDAINMPDHNGERPLCLAAKLHYTTLPSACRILLNYGAHQDATNFQGKTAAEFLSPNEALKLGFSQIAPLKCLASRKILAAKLPYDMLDSQLIEFMRMHATRGV